MPALEVVPVSTRVCDLCNHPVADGQLVVTTSFALTDWGVLCIECWDSRITHHEEFEVVRVYIKSQQIREAWARRPLVFVGFPPPPA